MAQSKLAPTRRYLWLLLVVGLALSGCGGGKSKAKSTAAAGTTSVQSTSRAGESTATDQAGSAADQAGSDGAAPTVAKVTGSVQLGNAYTGTYTWNDTLAITTCGTEIVLVTLTNGSEVISLGAGDPATGHKDAIHVAGNGVGMSTFNGPSGSKLDLKQTGSSVSGSVTFDGDAKEVRDPGRTLSVKGKLDFECP